MQPFYQYSPLNPDFAKILADKGRDQIDRELLQRVIKEQYQGLELGEKVAHHIELLGQPHTFTVTTGHQLVLWGGPMFTTYKVLHTLRLAEDLTRRFPQSPVVPIFWIHTEDHDFEEINHYYGDFFHKHTYQATCRGQVGDHLLTQEILRCCPPHFEQRLRQCYTPGTAMRDAFRCFIHELFGPYGIVMLDASDPRLKAVFSRVIREELQAQRSHSLIHATSAALESQGYSAQITPREINFFYVAEEIRNRIVRQGDHFQVLDTSLEFSMSQMMDLVTEHPERFSPNVSLRPLYQESILPNLAYIGGWGELSYWLQLKGVFEHYQVNFPALLPRFSATLLRESEAQALRGLGFEPVDVVQDLHTLYQSILPRIWQDDELAGHEAALRVAFDQMAAYIHTLSDTLPRSVIGQKVKTEKFLAHQRNKILKVLKTQHPDFYRLRELKHSIQADGMVQERVLGLPSFPDISPESLIRQIWAAVRPLPKEKAWILLNP